MATDSRNRNPTFWADYGPGTEVQARLTGTSQTGRLVILGNPISYVVESGRYFPFLSLRGHEDPMSRDLGERMRIGDLVGEEIPSNLEPHHIQGGYRRDKAPSSTRGAVQKPPLGRLANTSIYGTGPEGLPNPAMPDTMDFFSGIPDSTGLRGI
jgi:hypothetical protein